MAGRVRHLLIRHGRFYARLSVPAELRQIVGKRELTAALGPDRREALRLLPVVLGPMQQLLGEAQAKLEATRAAKASRHYAATPAELATALYKIRLGMDERYRNESPNYALMEIDDKQVVELRAAISGQLSDADLHDLTGDMLEYFRSRGLTSVKVGSNEWRSLARLLALAELEALQRVSERDSGDYSGETRIAALKTDPSPTPEVKADSVSIMGLFDKYISMKNQTSNAREVERRWRPVFHNLIKYLGHDDYNKTTKADFIKWRDSQIGRYSPYTISKTNLSAVKTVLNYAKDNLLIEENKIEGVKIVVPKKSHTREIGFTDDEAKRIIEACLNYEPAPNERAKKTFAKKWIPILIMFTGARVNELTQMRKEDLIERDGILAIRLNPEAGTVKNDEFRDVPLHPQIIELGFVDFVKASTDGPLFYDARSGEVSLKKARMVGGAISSWLKTEKLVPDGLQPNHASRHRFKTIGREVGIQDRILDAIQGHAPRSQGDRYGNVTLKTKAAAIKKIPRFHIK